MWPFRQEVDQEKTCKQCHYFNEYVFPDRLLPDKTVIRGGISHWECSRGGFDLNDLTPCELFVKNPGWRNRIPLPTLRIPPQDVCAREERSLNTSVNFGKVGAGCRGR